LAKRLAETDLQVTEIPINPEAKPRLAKLDRLVFSLLKVEEPCDLARIQLCDTVGQSMPNSLSLPCLQVYKLVAPTLVTHS
jgi:hypothetical protein